MQKVILFALGAALLTSGAQAQAQTRPATRPGAKTPAKRPAPVASKPMPKPTAAPVARPLAAAPVPSTRPTEAALAATVASPTPASAAAASPAVFGLGTNAVNLGIGFGLSDGLVGTNASSLPALSVSYTRGVAQVGPGTISVGGLVGYKSYTWSYGGDKAVWRHVFVGARGAYHYNFNNPKLDTYAGVGLGVRRTSYSASQSNSSIAGGSQVELNGFVGARYFFTNTLGAFSELGYDMSFLKVGVSARF